MSEHLLKDWEKNKEAIKKAKEWNDLPNGKSYCGGTFEISKDHCNPPMLTRMGQQVCGGQTYWKTENKFNDMILRYLVDNWEEHYPKIIKMMEHEERESLKKCKSYIEEMLNKIEDATNV